MTSAKSNRRKNRSDVITRMSLSDLRPAPENDELYRPIHPNDVEIIELARSIQEFGLREPLVVSQDRYLLSGHRRYVAAGIAGLTSIPCRIEPVSRSEDPDRFLRLLREYNRQRVKNHAEQLREEVVSMDPEQVHARLIAHRIRNSDLSESSTVNAIDAGKYRERPVISSAKLPMLQAVLKVINDRSDFWPLSDRSIHYALLNDPPLRHAAKPGSGYVNDRACYQDLTDLLTRARLAGLVPWNAIGDETRPVMIWNVAPSVQSFVREQLDGFLSHYWRDYQQSQANHIEIVAEKLSVRGIVEPVAQEFCIPLTIGRGYCSITPRWGMAERFRASGREQLVLVMVSDFDPDGETIAESFVRSMRDDFGIRAIVAVKAALTRDQVEKFQLPPQMKAKAGSSRYANFTDKHGDDVFELEALDPVELQNAVRRSVLSLLHIPSLQHEIDSERADAVFLEGVKRQAKRALMGLLDGNGN